MTSQLNKYRIYCNDENKYVYLWNKSTPSSCPNNNTHLINIDTITIVDKINNTDINIANQNIDIFGRLRISNANVIFTLHHALGEKSLYIDTKLVGNATSTLESSISSKILTVYNSGDRAIYQTRQYFPYIPGASKVIFLSGVLQNIATTGIKSRIGSFDNHYDKAIGHSGNGHFFEFYEDKLYVVERSSTRGSYQTDFRVEQNDWNVDKLDGSGPSGLTIDPTKALLFVIEYAWLGVNIVKMGFKINNYLCWCHIWDHSDLTVPYIKYAKLPIRYEIENVSAGEIEINMKVICASVIIEGGNNIENNLNHGINLTYSDDNQRIVLKNDWFPIFSIKLSNDVIRRSIAITKLTITTIENRPLKWRLLLNPVLINPIWSSNNNHPDSVADIDISTAIVGNSNNIQVGYPFESGTITGNFTQVYDFISPDIMINADIAGNSDIITLQARGITNNATFIYSIDWMEIF